MNENQSNVSNERQKFFHIDQKIQIKFLSKTLNILSSIFKPFWEEYSDENIKNAEVQRLNAIQLRSIIDGIFKKKLVADIKQDIIFINQNKT